MDEHRLQAEPERVTPGRISAPPGDANEPAEPQTTEAAGAAGAAGEMADLEDQLRRALADLDNLRKRFSREVARERANERSRLVAEWLPIVDNFERALRHAGADPATILEGLQAVHDQAVSVLERLGIPRFEDVGKPFNPVRHEAVGAVDDETPPGTVVGVVRPGYGTDEQMLRPAGVIVSRGSGDRIN